MLNCIKYLAFLLLFANLASAKMLKIAVIDTGLDLQDSRFASVLCKSGHKDFTGFGLMDEDGHGTHVAGLIKKYAGFGNYCMIILKFYDYRQTAAANANAELNAISEAIRLKADIVNLSEGGPSERAGEGLLLASDPTITYVIAAGNDSLDLDIRCSIYPACYKLPNVIVVGNLRSNGSKAISSNYGKRVNVWEIGDSVRSTVPRCKKCIDKYNSYAIMSGTSMACAIHTGVLIKERSLND